MLNNTFKEIKLARKSLRFINTTFQKMVEKERKVNFYLFSDDSLAMYAIFNEEKIKDSIVEYLFENSKMNVLKIGLDELYKESKILLKLFEDKIQPLKNAVNYQINEFATVDDAINYYEEYKTLYQFAYNKKYSVDDLYDYCRLINEFLNISVFADQNEFNTNATNTIQPIHPINSFCKGMSLEIPIKHFEVLSQNNKKGEPFITKDNLEQFIKRAFLNEGPIDKLNINYSKGEKGLIRYHFYKFYEKVVIDHENTNNCRDKYIKLLTDNFSNWEFKDTKSNFNKKPKNPLV